MEERRHERELTEKNKKLARERALVILQVRSGALTAKEGAKLLGVSRKTYYEWEEKSLKAMALALENHPAGRPPVPTDEEKETLRERIQSWRRNWIWLSRPSRSKNCWGPMRSFEIGALKKTDRSARGDKESCGDRAADEGTNKDALWDDL